MPTDHADWMHTRRVQLQVRPLCQIPLPGSHDAGSFGDMNDKSRTQEYSIADQLQYGVRYFDFRVKVDNGHFFSHHGLDDSRLNTFARWPVDPAPVDNVIFHQIAKFCDDHPGEIVVLNFTDFTAVPNQSFTDGDKRNFMTRMRGYFGDKMVHRDVMGPGVYGNRIPTYAECIGSGRRILVIVNENDVDVWKGHEDIWPAGSCWRDRFSAYSYAMHDWDTLINSTMQDQQDYLTGDGDDKRNLHRFWVSQTILDYPAYAEDGKSRNWFGAEKINPPFMEAYRAWWSGQSAIEGTTATVKLPNILLLDFSAVFDNFPEICDQVLF